MPKYEELKDDFSDLYGLIEFPCGCVGIPLEKPRDLEYPDRCSVMSLILSSCGGPEDDDLVFVPFLRAPYLQGHRGLSQMRARRIVLGYTDSGTHPITPDEIRHMQMYIRKGGRLEELAQLIKDVMGDA